MKISRIARERGIVYERLLTLFFIERMLARLVSRKSLARTLVFKGGYVQNRVYGSPRFTIDLDAVLKGMQLSNIETELVAVIESDIGDGAWFRFNERRTLELQNDYGGVRFSFRTGLGSTVNNVEIAQLINFDLGVGNAVTPTGTDTESLLGDRQISWNVYPTEFIVAEKLHATITRALENSRSKDIFDLFFLLPLCRPLETRNATAATFSNRGADLPQDFPSTFQNISTERLRIGWRKAVAGIKESPDFDYCLEEIKGELTRLFK
jgi:hypothetical protein